jgi:hypothetical protein
MDVWCGLHAILFTTALTGFFFLLKHRFLKHCMASLLHLKPTEAKHLTSMHLQVSAYVSGTIHWLKSYPHNRLRRPIGVWDVEDPTLSRQLAHRWWRGCQSHAQASFYSPRTFFIFVSGVHFCQRLSKLKGLVQLEGLGKSIKFNYLIGSQTHNLQGLEHSAPATILPHIPKKEPTLLTDLINNYSYEMSI